MRIKLALKAGKTIDGTFFPEGAEILEGELRDGITLDRVKLLLATNRVEWLEDEVAEVEAGGEPGDAEPRRGRRRQTA